MASSLLKTEIKIGALSLPVKVVSIQATGKGISFKSLCPKCSKPIQQKRVCAEHGEIAYSELEKGFALGKDIIPIPKEQIVALKSNLSKEIKVIKVLKQNDIDFRLVCGSYGLEPMVSEQKYNLIREALSSKGYALLVKFVVRDKENLGMIYPFRHTLILAKLVYSVADVEVEPMVMPKELVAKGVALLDKLYNETQEAEVKDNFATEVEALIEKIMDGKELPKIEIRAESKAKENLEAELTAALG